MSLCIDYETYCDRATPMDKQFDTEIDSTRREYLRGKVSWFLFSIKRLYSSMIYLSLGFPTAEIAAFSYINEDG